MFTDDKPSVAAIESRLLAAINHRANAFEDILDAITHVLIMQMALACPGCRKNIAKRLRRSVPDMLAYAN